MLTFNVQNKRLNLLLCSIIGINVLFVLWTLFYSAIIVCDDIEHLRAAYFVSIGDVPYRDFFEHHHPLLWYVLWPLIKVLPHSTIWSIYIGRALSLLVSFGTGYYFYQIMRRFIGGKTVALLAIVLYFASMPAWYSLINIKPDIYMRFFYFMGLYYLFLYFRYQKRRDLCACGVAWVIGFLFLQTITLDILPLVLPVGWFICRKKYVIKDFAIAAILPLLLLTVFCGVLFYANAWGQYFELNWDFNSKMTVFLHRISQSKYLILFADIIFLALAGCIYYLKTTPKINIYRMALILLFFSELLQRIFWVSILSQYFVMLFAFAAMITAPMIYKIGQKNPLPTYSAVAIFVVLHIILNELSLFKYSFSKQPFYYLETRQVPLEQTYGLDCGIYQPRKTYYWMMIDMETLHNLYYNRFPDYRLTDFVHDEQIRFYCLSQGMDKYAQFEQQVKTLLPLTDLQRQILQRHIFSEDFHQTFQPISIRLYQRQE